MVDVIKWYTDLARNPALMELKIKLILHQMVDVIKWYTDLQLWWSFKDVRIIVELHSASDSMVDAPHRLA